MKRRGTYNLDKATQLWPVISSAASMRGSSHALFEGDALETLRKLPTGCVTTCLTSPPYWGARNYEHEYQIGLEADVNEYIERIVAVFAEVKRLLIPKGVAWLNLGDRYLNGVGTINGKPPKKGWRRNKQLSLVPFRLAIALQEDGWWIRNVMVWHKPNAMPISAFDRFSNNWEPVFLLTKGERYFFDLDAVRIPHKTDDSVERQRAISGKANGKAKGHSNLRKWLNSPRHRATIEGLRTIERRPNAPESVELARYLRESADKCGLSIRDVAGKLGQPFERVRHYFRVDQIGSRLPPPDTWEQLKRILQLDGSYDEAMNIEYGDNVFRNHPKGRNPGDVQTFAVSSSEREHFATMPLSLAVWALKATLPKGGVCLDPFMGHGTTGQAAIQLGGRFIGVDIHQQYLAEFVQDMKEDSRPSRSIHSTAYLPMNLKL